MLPVLEYSRVRLSGMPSGATLPSSLPGHMDGILSAAAGGVLQLTRTRNQSSDSYWPHFSKRNPLKINVLLCCVV